MANLQVHKVTIGDQELLLPFARFETGSSARIIITGGVDGDEYAAIEAAYLLISRYQTQKPALSLTIFPLVNIPGFREGVSYNVLDGLYPKHLFPGKETGKPTEQLMFSLASFFTKDTVLWIDLHSGSLRESLTPFVWTYKTNTKTVDQITMRILSQLSAERKIYHKSPFSKITSLAKQNIAYCMLEAGERGERNDRDIETLISWTDAIVASMAKNANSSPAFSAATFVDEYVSTRDGLWYPSSHVGDEIEKGETVGIISSLTRDKTTLIKAKMSGEILWQRSSLSVRSRDIILGVGVKKQDFRK